MVNKIKSYITKTDKIAFIAGVVICLITNLFLYTNTLFLHDSIRFFYDTDQINNGRLLLGPLSYLINKLNLPWVIGVLSCLIFGLITVCICRILNINKPLFIFLVAGIIITNSTVIDTNCYFSSSYMYFLSCLLALLSVITLDKKHGWIFSIILLVLSCSIYQAYIGTAFVFMMVKLLVDIFEDKYKTKKEIFKKFGKILLIIGSSAILYYIIWKISILISGNNVVNYYAYYNLNANSLNFLTLYERTLAAFFTSITTIFKINTSPIVITVVSIILNAASIMLLLILGKKKKHLLFVIFSIILMFVGINAMYIISGTIRHWLVQFSHIVFLLFLIYLGQNSIKNIKIAKIIQYITSALLIFVILFQFVSANSLYTKISLNFNNTYSYCTRLIDRIEQTDGFDPKSTKIVIVSGDFVEPVYPTNKEIDERLESIDGFNYFKKSTVLTYPLTLKWFLSDEMNIGNKIIMGGQKYIDEMKDCEIFPAKNSIQFNEKLNEIIVKVSDTSETVISREYWD